MGKRILYVGIILLIIFITTTYQKNNFVSEKPQITQDEKIYVEEEDESTVKIEEAQDLEQDILVEPEEVEIAVENIEKRNSSQDKIPQKDTKSTSPAPVKGSQEPKTTSEVNSNPQVENPPQPIAPQVIELTPQQVEAQIKLKYTSLFNNLKLEFEGKVNNLISQAKGEYLALTEKERKLAKFKLGLKYLNLGSALEKECDARFYALLDQMKTELKNNNLSVAIANEAEDQYKAQKTVRRKALLAKAL